MERHLAQLNCGGMELDEAIRTAFHAWTIGQLSREEDAQPTPEAIEAAKKERLGQAVIEAAILDRNTRQAASYRSVQPEEIEKALG